jgi:Skp family chaperone for outer membrane proteins
MQGVRRVAPLFLALTGGVVGCAPQGQLRVGLVDGPRVTRLTKRGKEIRKQINKKTDQLAKRLVAHQQRLKELNEKVQRLSKTLPETDARLIATRRSRKKAAERLRGVHRELQLELNRYGGQLLKSFKEAIRKVAMKIKEREGLDLVIMVSREDDIWFWPVIDITDKVINVMDGDEQE